MSNLSYELHLRKSKHFYHFAVVSVIVHVAFFSYFIVLPELTTPYEATKPLKILDGYQLTGNSLAGGRANEAPGQSMELPAPEVQPNQQTISAGVDTPMLKESNLGVEVQNDALIELPQQNDSSSLDDLTRSQQADAAIGNDGNADATQQNPQYNMPIVQSSSQTSMEEVFSPAITEAAALERELLHQEQIDRLESEGSLLGTTSAEDAEALDNFNKMYAGIIYQAYRMQLPNENLMPAGKGEFIVNVTRAGELIDYQANVAEGAQVIGNYYANAIESLFPIEPIPPQVRPGVKDLKITIPFHFKANN